MKLTSAQVERTLTQFQGEAIPDNHPVVRQLNNLFGEHTFSRREWAQHRRADRGCGAGTRIGAGGESCQLEPSRPKSFGAPRTRADGHRRYARVRTLIGSADEPAVPRNQRRRPWPAPRDGWCGRFCNGGMSQVHVMKGACYEIDIGTG